MMADLVREAFETWGKSKYLYLERANERQITQGRSYYTEQSENMWLAFQAGAALATPSPSPVSAPSPAGEDPRWQKLRDMLGLDGWHDGRFNGLPNPDQIVTHVQHVANERARLLLATSPAGGVREAAISLFHAFAAGVGYRDVSDRKLTREQADRWVKDSTADFEATLDRLADLSPATPEPVSAPENGEVVAAVERVLSLEFGVDQQFFTDDEWSGGMSKLFAALSNPAPGHGEGDYEWHPRVSPRAFGGRS